MGGLITAEFRKVSTTRLWWALLLPAVGLAFLWAFIWAKLATGFGQGIADDPTFQRIGLTFAGVPWNVFAVSRSINISTIFPMVFGALGLSSELRRRTITTSFLTAPSRASMLSAKAIVYVAWGLVYGLVIVGVAWLGTLAGSGGHYLPDAVGFLQLSVAGVIESVLWTLLGLGVGALLGSTTGSVVLLLIYSVLAEPILDLVLRNHVAGSLPNGSADGLTGSTAAQIFLDKAQSYQNSPLVQAVGTNAWNTFVLLVRGVAGAIGAFDWWASGLIFLGWALVFFLAGMLINQRRDIT
jgi:ABC-2 type transport system permease protein